MASTQELKDVIKETLENHGTLGQIKARIRAEVFNSLEDQAEAKPPISSENLIINELIREYLEFNKYKYSSSVLTVESGQPKEPLNRDFLARELNIRESHTSSSVDSLPKFLMQLNELNKISPLLYSIVSHYIKDNRLLTSQSRPHDGAATQVRAAFTEHLGRDEAAEQGVVVIGGKR